MSWNRSVQNIFSTFIYITTGLTIYHKLHTKYKSFILWNRIQLFVIVFLSPPPVVDGKKMESFLSSFCTLPRIPLRDWKRTVYIGSDSYFTTKWQSLYPGHYALSVVPWTSGWMSGLWCIIRLLQHSKSIKKWLPLLFMWQFGFDKKFYREISAKVHLSFKANNFGRKYVRTFLDVEYPQKWYIK